MPPTIEASDRLAPLNCCMQVVVLFLRLFGLGAVVGVGFALVTAFFMSQIIRQPTLVLVLTWVSLGRITQWMPLSGKFHSVGLQFVHGGQVAGVAALSGVLGTYAGADGFSGAVDPACCCGIGHSACCFGIGHSACCLMNAPLHRAIDAGT